MMVVYIAGPFRAANAWELEQNMRRAEAVALEVWRAGFAALCPHCNSRNFQDAAPDKTFLDGGIEMMKRCDAVVMVEGWRSSSGSRYEYDIAVASGIPVFRNVAGLVDYCLATEKDVEAF